jgi:hypothetical protein
VYDEPFSFGCERQKKEKNKLSLISFFGWSGESLGVRRFSVKTSRTADVYAASPPKYYRSKAFCYNKNDATVYEARDFRSFVRSEQNLKSTMYVVPDEAREEKRKKVFYCGNGARTRESISQGLEATAHKPV